jgi:hypothetical protein
MDGAPLGRHPEPARQPIDPVNLELSGERRALGLAGLDRDVAAITRRLLDGPP